MAFDQPKLLLFANVIAITAVTALALMWFLRKKDQQRLMGALNMGRPVAPPPAADPVQKVEQSPEQDPVHGPVPTPVVLPEMDRDIRQFVTRRAQAWSAPSVSQWSKRLNADQPPGLRRVAGDGDPIELP